MTRVFTVSLLLLLLVVGLSGCPGNSDSHNQVTNITNTGAGGFAGTGNPTDINNPNRGNVNQPPTPAG